jgi:hypothetical protein
MMQGGTDMPRQVNPSQLADELTAVGVTVAPDRIGWDDERVYTYDAVGEIIDFPEAADAVIAAHVPQVVPVPDPLADAARALKAAAPGESGLSAGFKDKLGALVDALLADRGAGV